MDIFIIASKLQEVPEKVKSLLKDIDVTLHESDGILKVISGNNWMTIKNLDINNELSLSAITLMWHQNLTLRFAAQDPLLHLVYCLEGGCSVVNIFNNMEYQVKPGQMIIYSVKETIGPLVTFPAYQKVKLLVLQLSGGEHFNSMSASKLPPSVRQMFEGTSIRPSCFYQGQFSSTLAESLVHVLSKSWKGSISDVLLEAEGLEILGLQLDQYSKDTIND